MVVVCIVYLMTISPTVGKLRKRWVQNALSSTGVKMLKALKEDVDPQNIFGAGNLIPT